MLAFPNPKIMQRSSTKRHLRKGPRLSANLGNPSPKADLGKWPSLLPI